MQTFQLKLQIDFYSNSKEVIMYRNITLLMLLSMAGRVSLHAEEIHEAVTSGDREKVNSVLFSDKYRYTNPLTQMNENGYLPIHIAAKQGNLEMIPFLIHMDSDVTARTRNGLTAAEVAQRNNNDKVATTLRTMELHSAIARGKTEQASQILKDNAQLAQESANGEKAIHVAAEFSREEMVKPLIDAGADPNAQTERIKETPLHMASTPGVTITLLRNGAKPNVMGHRKNSPLHEAADDNFKVGEYLIQAGAKVNAQNKFGYTPLHNAVTAENTELIRVLIDNKAKVNIQSDQGRTPLHVSRSEQTAQILINAGADVNIQDKDGDTQLHNPFVLTKPKVVATLIANGADVTITNTNGKTPLDVAQKRKYIGIPDRTITLLKEAKQTQAVK